MARITSVGGVRTVINNLRRKDRAFGKGIERGLKKGGLLIQRGAQLMTPVDTGALKASGFTRSKGTGFQTQVTVGFDTSYTMFVHEAKGTYLGKKIPRRARYKGHKPKGNYWDPEGRGQPKYLEKSVVQNKNEVQKTVRREAFKAKFL